MRASILAALLLAALAIASRAQIESDGADEDAGAEVEADEEEVAVPQGGPGGGPGGRPPMSAEQQEVRTCGASARADAERRVCVCGEGVGGREGQQTLPARGVRACAWRYHATPRGVFCAGKIADAAVARARACARACPLSPPPWRESSVAPLLFAPHPR